MLHVMVDGMGDVSQVGQVRYGQHWRRVRADGGDWVVGGPQRLTRLGTYLPTYLLVTCLLGQDRWVVTAA